MTKLRNALLGAVAIGISFSAAAERDQRYVSFGDSLSDAGNLAILGAAPPPPYFQGRFSNGPIWIDLISGGQEGFATSASPPLDAGVNYAFGGARTDALGELNSLAVAPGAALPGVTSPLINLPPGVETQIESFLNRGGSFGSGDIVTIWAGANNFLGLFDIPGSNDPALAGYVAPTPSNIAATARAAAADIGRSIDRLYAAGARRFHLNDVPNLGATPGSNGDALTAIGGLIATIEFNFALDRELANAVRRHPHARISFFSANSLLGEAIQDPGRFGLSNVTDSCIEDPACVADEAVADQFLFWDDVHPTRAGHAQVANFAASCIAPGWRPDLLKFRDLRTGRLTRCFVI